ncbi:MAG: cytochrome-c oxidase [Bacteroidetes bacterium]|jgi:cytochrome c oxidase subunit IV|nr:cytochrome-c oxidase [Bacteroidota bacterium]MBT3748829.1 cytochrome-c oxidase [Bacteroidota bacterium]MBT4399571.1 cytochrome-c oxidase [Bacteroidota bacterium]MBT4409629.1 cytochrome-c oxidase [Bacteroidota bacterium]MBT7093278.1 cytochrome-c oxidase [Bacteroidota bacterium]
MKNDKHPHISSYNQHITVLLVLLILTFITVAVSGLHFSTFSVGVALIIASVKGATVLTYFMHLKYESLFLKLIVAGVFLVYALVIVLTFTDYLLR